MKKTKIETLIEEFNLGSNLFITGQAGTGKTTLLNEFIGWLEEQEYSYALAGSTGTAAINIGGSTLHKLLGVQICKDVREYESRITNEEKFRISAFKARKQLKLYDTIIVDEVSMISKGMMDLFDHVLRKTMKNDSPFGGVRIILTGDFLQLPPINDDFAFESDSWSNGNFKNIILEKVHRQENTEFTDVLSDLRQGNKTKDLLKYFKEISKKKNYPEDAARLFTRNSHVDNVNELKISELPGKSKFFEARLTGQQKAKDDLAKGINAPTTLELKVGAKVMCLKNDEGMRYVNGSIGVVKSMSDASVIVKLDNGSVVNITPYKWNLLSPSGKVIATFEQIPLRPAYALTMHKSQGATIDSDLIVDCDGIRSEGQLYVAVSRIRDPERLYLVNFNEQHIMANEKAIGFYDGTWVKGESLSLNDDNTSFGDMSLIYSNFEEEQLPSNEDVMEALFESESTNQINDINSITERYSKLLDKLNALEEEKKLLREQMIKNMTVGEQIISNGLKVHLKEHVSRSVDYNLLEEDFPEAFDKVVRRTTKEMLVVKKDE